MAGRIDRNAGQYATLTTSCDEKCGLLHCIRCLLSPLQVMMVCQQLAHEIEASLWIGAPHGAPVYHLLCRNGADQVEYPVYDPITVHLLQSIEQDVDRPACQLLLLITLYESFCGVRQVFLPDSLHRWIVVIAQLTPT